jgi:hypothetical protein
MARTGGPKPVLLLDDQVRATLAHWARRPSSPQSLALRSKIVLACSAGKSDSGGGSRGRCCAGRAGQVAIPVGVQAAAGPARWAPISSAQNGNRRTSTSRP